MKRLHAALAANAASLTFAFAVALAAGLSVVPASLEALELQGDEGNHGTPLGGAPGATSLANYQPSRMIEMRPDEKRPLLLRGDERNPYARRSPDQEAESDESESLQELRIRETLNLLSITGRSQGAQGLRLLLGDIIVEEGRVLPPLLEDQSEDLRVAEVTSESVVFAWLDLETGEPTGKTLQIAYDLTPSVSYALHGQAREAHAGEDPESRRMTVIRPSEEERRVRARLAASAAAAAAAAAPQSDLPEEVIQAGQ